MITSITVDGDEMPLVEAESFAFFEAADDSGALLRVSSSSLGKWTVERCESKVRGWRPMGHVRRDENLFVAYASTLSDPDPLSSHKLLLDAVEAVGVDGPAGAS